MDQTAVFSKTTKVKGFGMLGPTQGISIKLMRGVLTEAHAIDPASVTVHMLAEFEADMASGDPDRIQSGIGRAAGWRDTYEKRHEGR